VQEILKKGGTRGDGGTENGGLRWGHGENSERLKGRGTKGLTLFKIEKVGVEEMGGFEGRGGTARSPEGKKRERKGRKKHSASRSGQFRGKKPFFRGIEKEKTTAWKTNEKGVFSF